MKSERLKYPPVNDKVSNYTINNSNLNVDKTVKELFYNFCNSYEISKYKAINILLHSFMYDEKFNELRKDFFENNFQKEKTLVETLLNNKDKKLYKKQSKELPEKSKITVPRNVYLSFCRACRSTKKRPSLAIISAIESYIYNISWENKDEI